jgi:hypothetical protein
MVKRLLFWVLIFFFNLNLFNIVFRKWIEVWINSFMPQAYAFITISLIITLVFTIGYSFACFDKSVLTKKPRSVIWDLRKTGINLRVQGYNLETNDEIIWWNSETDKWVSELVQETKKVSVKLSKRIESLGNIKAFPYPVNYNTQEEYILIEEYLLKLYVLHERLERLEDFLLRNNEM